MANHRLSRQLRTPVCLVSFEENLHVLSGSTGLLRPCSEGPVSGLSGAPSLPPTTGIGVRSLGKWTDPTKNVLESGHPAVDVLERCWFLPTSTPSGTIHPCHLTGTF